MKHPELKSNPALLVQKRPWNKIKRYFSLNGKLIWYFFQIRNETERKKFRNGTKRNETERNGTKRNETERNGTKRNENKFARWWNETERKKICKVVKRNGTKSNSQGRETKRNETQSLRNGTKRNGKNNNVS
jgi:hypothetical protein